MAKQERIFIELDRPPGIETRGSTGTHEDNVNFIRLLAKDWPVIRVLNEHGDDVTDLWVEEA